MAIDDPDAQVVDEQHDRGADEADVGSRLLWRSVTLPPDSTLSVRDSVVGGDDWAGGTAPVSRNPRCLSQISRPSLFGRRPILHSHGIKAEQPIEQPKDWSTTDPSTRRWTQLSRGELHRGLPACDS